MDTNHFRKMAALLAVFAFMPLRIPGQAPAVVTAPAAATLGITPPPGKTGGHVLVNDPANREWALQTSSDMVHWSEFGRWKIHNGFFRVPYLYDATAPGVFFRGYYDPARQEITSTINTALLL